MSRYGQELGTDAFRASAPKGEIAFFELSATEAATADTDGIIDGGECSASEAVEIEVEEELQKLPACRNVTATPGGTSANIKAVSVTVFGEDINGDPITEVLPAFTADSTAKVTGVKCFSKVTKISVPAMDGSGVTVDLGYGDKYGIPFKFAAKPLCLGSVAGTQETVNLTIDASNLSKNCFTFSSAPAGEAVKVAFIL